MSNEEVYTHSSKTDEPAVDQSPEPAAQSGGGFFGYFKKKAEPEKTEETDISSEFEKKVNVSEPEPVLEEKHDSLLDKFQSDDGSSKPEAAETAEKSPEPVEQTGRGLFGFMKKKEEPVEPEKCEETGKSSEFEEKVDVSEPEPVLEEKHDSAVMGVKEYEDGEKIQKPLEQVLEEKIEDYNEKKEDEDIKMQEEDTHVPIEKYQDEVAVPPPHSGVGHPTTTLESEEKKGVREYEDKVEESPQYSEPEEKKGFTEYEEKVVETPQYSEPEEKKGFKEYEDKVAETPQYSEPEEKKGFTEYEDKVAETPQYSEPEEKKGLTEYEEKVAETPQYSEPEEKKGFTDYEDKVPETTQYSEPEEKKGFTEYEDKVPETTQYSEQEEKKGFTEYEDKVAEPPQYSESEEKKGFIEYEEKVAEPPQYSSPTLESEEKKEFTEYKDENEVAFTPPHSEMVHSTLTLEPEEKKEYENEVAVPPPHSEVTRGFKEYEDEVAVPPPHSEANRGFKEGDITVPPPHSEVVNPTPTLEPEEKMGFMEKIKKKLPGGHKKNEEPHDFPSPSAPIGTPYDGLDEPKEKKGFNEYENEVAVPPPHSEVANPTPTGEPEEKKGFMEKIKNKLPGGNKKVEEEHDVLPPSASYDGLEEPKEKKSIMGKIKEKMPGYHSKSEEEKYK